MRFGNSARSCSAVALFSPAALAKPIPRSSACSGETEWPLAYMTGADMAMIFLNKPLAFGLAIRLTDLYGETILMVERGDTSYIDNLREEIEENHPQIHIHDVPPYDFNVFNYAENTGRPMISVDLWDGIHPALVTLTCDWGKEYAVPYGILYAKDPTEHVMEFIHVMERVMGR